MKKDRIHRLAGSAMMAALVLLVTMVLRVPSPMGGFVNLGDAPVLLSGWLLGPWWGAAAAGLGAAAADLLSGAAYFAPGTFLVKGAMAVAAALVAKRLTPRLRPFWTGLWAGIVAELVMIVGYFGYTSLLLGRGLAAAASIPGNCLQALATLVIALPVMAGIARRSRE